MSKILTCIAISISLNAWAQYPIGEFQAGLGVSLGGSIDSKLPPIPPSSYSEVLFQPSTGLYIGYSQYLNRAISIGAMFFNTSGKLANGENTSGDILGSFTYTGWSAHVMAGTSRFKPISVYGVVRFMNFSIHSDKLPVIFEVDDDTMHGAITTLGVGANWNFSRLCSITLIEFSVGGGNTDAGGFNGQFLTTGYLRSGLNLKLWKK